VDLESHLHRNGTRIIKFFLHLSKEEQSKAHPETIELFARLKKCHELKLAVVNNEGRELNAYRIRTFGLERLADFFVSSCTVHRRKPDEEMFRLALELAQVPARQVVYVDDTPMFVDLAAGLGIRSILHTSHETTRARLASLGLTGASGEP
jgi:putative hydrolase of the HAD superfamily